MSENRHLTNMKCLRNLKLCPSIEVVDIFREFGYLAT